MDSDKQETGNGDAPQDKWGDLLSGLGIEPKDEPQQPEAASPQSDETLRDETQTQAEPPAETHRTEHTAPARPTSGWNDLASDFGLEVAQPAAEEDPAAEPPVAATVEDAPAEPAIAETPPEANQAEFASADESIEEEAAELAEESPEDSVAEPVVVDQAIREVEIEVETEPESDGFAAGVHTEASAEADQPPAAPAGFGGTGLTLPDWFPFGGRKKNKQAEQAKEQPTGDDDASVLDDSEPTPGPDDTAVFVRDTPTATPAEGTDLTGEATIQDDAGEDGVAEEGEDSTEEKPKRSRRRRGRRRGRGRGRGKASAENGENGEAGEDEDTSPAEVASGGSHLESDNDQDEFQDEQGEGKSRSISHKNIPPWQEAIGVVVDSNIAARGQRKRSNTRGRGGSRGGRGRGRRRSSNEGGNNS